MSRSSAILAIMGEAWCMSGGGRVPLITAFRLLGRFTIDDCFEKQVPDKLEFEYHDFMSVYCSPWVSIKSSKSLENKGFFTVCSPYPFIRFHTSLPLP